MASLAGVSGRQSAEQDTLCGAAVEEVKTMDTDTKMKLKPILLRSKLGQFVSEDEHAFARLCWRQWPKEYSALQTQEVNPEAARQITSTRPSAHFNSTQPRTPHTAGTPRTPARRGRRS
jgi:hypothetical protein